MVCVWERRSERGREGETGHHFYSQTFGGKKVLLVPLIHLGLLSNLTGTMYSFLGSRWHPVILLGWFHTTPKVLLCNLFSEHKTISLRTSRFQKASGDKACLDLEFLSLKYTEGRLSPKGFTSLQWRQAEDRSSDVRDLRAVGCRCSWRIIYTYIYLI